MEPVKFDGVNVVFGENQHEYTPIPAARQHVLDGGLMLEEEL